MKFLSICETDQSLFFLIEACEAGSMFDGWFPTNTSALVLSATNPSRPSYACYADKTLGTYLVLIHSNLLDLLIHMSKLLDYYQTNTSPVSLYGDKHLLHFPLERYWGKHLGGVQESSRLMMQKLINSKDLYRRHQFHHGILEL